MNVVFVNSKGGVGKSTLAAHLAMWAADRGIAVALLDCDKQRSSSQWLKEADPRIATATADTPEECLDTVMELRKQHDLLIGDGPAGLDELSRTLLVIAELAVLPLTPSILDLRSIQQTVGILRFAQKLNGGLPDGMIVLNRMKTRDSISTELRAAAASLNLPIASSVIRDLQAYRDAAGQATSVMQLGRRGVMAAVEINALFEELVGKRIGATNGIEKGGE